MFTVMIAIHGFADAVASIVQEHIVLASAVRIKKGRKREEPWSPK